MQKYFELATDISNEELAELAKGIQDGSVHPRDAKMKLAGTLVRMYHGEEAAEAAKQHFVTVFQQRALPDDIEEFTLTSDQLEDGGIRVIQLLTHLGFVASNGEAKRSIQQGSVKINEEKWTDVNGAYTPQEGDIVQVGKRKFAKIKLD